MSSTNPLPFATLSTGVPEFDAVLPGGGYPRGRITEVVSPSRTVLGGLADACVRAAGSRRPVLLLEAGRPVRLGADEEVAARDAWALVAAGEPSLEATVEGLVGLARRRLVAGVFLSDLVGQGGGEDGASGGVQGSGRRLRRALGLLCGVLERHELAVVVLSTLEARPTPVSTMLRYYAWLRVRADLRPDGVELLVLKSKSGPVLHEARCGWAGVPGLSQRAVSRGVGAGGVGVPARAGVGAG